MKILSIDTTGAYSSVAIYDDGKITQVINRDDYSHLQKLVPCIKNLMEQESLLAKELDAIAVSRGPGSFTGIRIGMASAKGLAEVWGKPIIEVPTLAGFAFNNYDWIEEDKKLLLVPILDAKMHQVYAAAYEKNDTNPIICEGVYNLDDFLLELEKIASSYDAVVFFGDAEKTFNERLSEEDFTFAYAPQEDYYQSAAGVAVLGSIYFEKGINIKSCFDAQPEYFRLPEAERQRKEKEENK